MLKRNDTFQKNFKRQASALVYCAVLLLAPQMAFGQAQILDVHEPLPDIDTRTEKIAPNSTQVVMVARLGAAVRWNKFGTPQSLIKYGGYLATGQKGAPTIVARNWIRTNRALFRLSDQGVDDLELVNASKLVGSNGYAILFRQKFGDLAAAQDGMISIGLANGNIVYVSSSAVGDQYPPGEATISATAAWQKAATDVERFVPVLDIKNIKVEDGWTIFNVVGFSHPQRSRLVAFPTVSNGVRSAFETIVLDNQGGASTAYTHFIDAQTGEVLFRQNKVYRLAAPAPAPAPVVANFNGAFNPPTSGSCGPKHGPYVANANAQSIDIFATADVASNDIVLKLYFNNTVVASNDTGTSPEAVHYAPSGGVPAGNYFVEVCLFDDPTVPPQAPFTYHGTIAINDTVNPTSVPYPPQWKFFKANPPLNTLAKDPWNNPDTDTRIQACWESAVNGNPIPGCQLSLDNLAARMPWDFDPLQNAPTFTTKGNAANTAEAWFSPLTPGPTGFRPTSQDRKYNYPWTNQWFKGKCSQANFVPGVGNDISAAVVHLFATHNRMHDWSYFLGFTERNYNMQESNFGIGQPGAFPIGREKDPEIGDVQAGAANGGAPGYLGRDNANQITLNDGVPGITNQYLFQPIAAAFYSPCVDGDYDSSVVAHEYTHAISNRMVGGPDSNLTGHQAGAMGESWSDLVAVEYLNEYKYVPSHGENPFSVGAYVTGNKQNGIRNFGMNVSPLNYSDVGYDITGPQVHADGEIWSATNFEIRQALINKYNDAFPATDQALQKRCAAGILPADKCPGNRRWIQIVFDAFLLMQPAVSMLDARDAYLAADVMRSGGANLKELWKAFALRGMGFKATTTNTDDHQPKPSFESPMEISVPIKFTILERETNAAIANARIYVGDYEARVTPIADTFPSAVLPNTVNFVRGTYNFIVQSPGHGAYHFTFTVGHPREIVLKTPINWASKTKGGVAAGDGVNHTHLIDDTESTNWASLNSPVAGKRVTVKLGGGTHTVQRVQVSALLRPADANNANDSAGQNRFSALRRFEIYVCTAGANLLNPTCLNSNPVGFTKIYTSPADAFPGRAPRPIAPDLTLREFDVPDTAATHVQIRVLTNQCTGGPAFLGEQDSDPVNATDCTGTVQASNVRITELQVFAFPAPAQPKDPAVLMTMTGPATAIPGSRLSYEIKYSNLGPASASNAVVTDQLPAELDFVSASNGGKYNPQTRTVTWNLGTVPVSNDNKLVLNVRVKNTVSVNTIIVNEAEFTAPLTIASPAVALTKVLLQ